jgi:octaheme c-type cytochrome (tetrathionate reductase family)
LKSCWPWPTASWAKVMFLFIIAGVVLSCLHQSSLGTLMLIAPHKVHPLWNTPILPLLFLMSALAAGFPMVTFESLVVSKSFGRKPEMEVLTPLAKYMPVLMGIYLATKLGDMIYRGSYVYLFDGSTQSNAFMVEVLCGVTLPFVLLLFRKVRQSPGWLFFASTLYVIGIVLNRINVFLVSYSPPYEIESYFPTVGEVFITVGLISALMFLYRVAVFIFPVLGAQPKKMSSAAMALIIMVTLAWGALGQASPARAEDDKISLPGQAAITRMIGQAPRLLMLNSPVINKLSDDYEPVRFMHRKHAGVVKDCAICHHRMPKSEGDTYGAPMTQAAMADMEMEPAKCSLCHGEPFDPKNLHTPGLKGAYHRLCMDCHQEADQTPHQRGPVMYSSMVRGPEVRPLDTQAPTDCLACHARKVPDHGKLVKIEGEVNPFSVTQNCLSCHEKEGQAILKTSHWNWQGASPFTVGHEKRNDLGKRHATINNFCINLNGNWPRCTSCHIGYGWKDAGFDFKDPGKIDCLICHDTTGTYSKTPTGAGMPAKNVDLLRVAQKVGRPSRDTCGMNCHFVGGGGDAVKHGDMSSAMAKPTRMHDVHMSTGDDGMNFRCQDCHKTRNHMISGRSISVPAVEGDLSCEYCHSDKPHVGGQATDHHLNKHAEHVACQTCHIPVYSKAGATKVHWDWSTAGKDVKASRDQHGMPDYNKKKGNFKWVKWAKPEYRWYNGTVKRHLLGDRITGKGPIELAAPVGGFKDSASRIYPFKVHRGKQPADPVHKHLIAPKLFGGFWKHWNWKKAAKDGMKAQGCPSAARSSLWIPPCTGA